MSHLHTCTWHAAAHKAATHHFSRQSFLSQHTNLSSTACRMQMQVSKAALSLSSSINNRRKARGLQPRPVRAAVIGFPNVGKSALINRFLSRRVCESAPKPGVTKQLRWLRVGGDLDLLDAPGELSSCSHGDSVQAGHVFTAKCSRTACVKISCGKTRLTTPAAGIPCSRGLGLHTLLTLFAA